MYYFFIALRYLFALYAIYASITESICLSIASFAFISATVALFGVRNDNLLSIKLALTHCNFSITSSGVSCIPIPFFTFLKADFANQAIFHQCLFLVRVNK